MFMFAFDEVLFRFQYEKPAFDLLFQFPPTMASAHSISLLMFKIKTLGGDPQTP